MAQARVARLDEHRHADMATGELVPDCPRCRELEGDLGNAERALRLERRKVQRLTADKQRERQLHAHRAFVERIFAHWQAVCRHPRSKLTPERFDAICARIEDGYEPRDFDLAIKGAAFDPFVTEARNGRRVRHDDIELVCRDGKHFESFANRAPTPRSA